ncbi:MAG: class I SAM-dependent methyltransferase [Chloroflexota bacterium]
MTEERKFDPQHKGSLDDDKRQRLLDTGQILPLLPLQPGQAVGDIGCGTGYFAEPLARAVGTGTVFALDVQPEMVKATQERAARAGLANLKAELAGEARFPLPPASLDGALAAFVLHEVDDLAATLAEMRRVLKPGGWFAILEWHRRESPGGPPQRIRLSPADLQPTLEAAHFTVEAESTDINDYHYLLIARRSLGT